MLIGCSTQVSRVKVSRIGMVVHGRRRPSVAARATRASDPAGHISLQAGRRFTSGSEQSQQIIRNASTMAPIQL